MYGMGSKRTQLGAPQGSQCVRNNFENRGPFPAKVRSNLVFLESC